MIHRTVLAVLLASLALNDGREASQEAEQGHPKVLAFTASWCGPCQRAKPTLTQIQAAGVEVQVIDIDEHSELVRKHNVTAVPTFIVYVRGKASVRTNDIREVVSLTRSGGK